MFLIFKEYLVKNYLKGMKPKDLMFTRDYKEAMFKTLIQRNELHLLFVFEYAQNSNKNFQEVHYSEIDFNKAPISRELLIEYISMQSHSSDGMTQHVLMGEFKRLKSSEELHSVFGLHREYLVDYISIN